MLIVVSLGLLAAFLFAASASIQQHAAQQTEHAPADADRRAVVPGLWRLIRRLVRTPLWLAGWATNLVGFMTQGAALHFGSVATVQPLLVSQLLFALPLSSAWARRWPERRAWVSGSVICGGLVVFLTVQGVAPLEGEADRSRVILAGLSAVAAVIVLVLASARRPPMLHATLMAVAAGICFAMSAVLMKLTAQDLVEHGVAATAVDWPGYALAVSTGAGLVIEQGAFATGSLATAVSAMTITNPLVSYVVGVLAFNATPPESPSALAALAAAGAMISLGVIGLAHSPVAQPNKSTVPGRDAQRSAAEAPVSPPIPQDG